MKPITEKKFGNLIGVIWKFSGLRLQQLDFSITSFQYSTMMRRNQRPANIRKSSQVFGDQTA
jgi:hypothetical protein